VGVLVAAASKHGATREIGELIGSTLAEFGVANDVRPVEDIAEIDRYSAVVLGSAVYFGHWIEPARRFVDAFADDLRKRPVWLFSSGPIGQPPRPAATEAVNVEAITEAIHPLEHRVFSGRIDRSALSFSERAMVAAVRR
jgi:menaquinone-dependent protoporphyrinogen oxidase